VSTAIHITSTSSGKRSWDNASNITWNVPIIIEKSGQLNILSILPVLSVINRDSAVPPSYYWILSKD
jgi:hypothetical protein